MKKYLLVFITILLTVSGYSQKNTADIGIWGGGATYWGDLKEVQYGQSINPMFGAFFRYNFNPRYNIRMMYLTGNVGATGIIETEPWSFEKYTHNISLMIEINYLKYILGNKKTPVSPYILGGFGLMHYSYLFDQNLGARLYAVNKQNPFLLNNSYWDNGILVIQSHSPVYIQTPTLNFGMGLKTHIGKRFGLGAEFIIQKLFDDKLDDLDDPLATRNQLGTDITYSDFLHNNDYTFYAGIHLTYKIFLSKEMCPAYESKN